MEAARGTELAVQRFQAEVRKNQSEKLIVRQEIIEVENRINFLVGRFPQPVERMSAEFFDLNHSRAERGSARAAASEPTRHPPGRARAGGCRARREGRPGPLLSHGWTSPAGVGYAGLQPKVSVLHSGSLDCQCRWRPGRAVDQQDSDPGRIPRPRTPGNCRAVYNYQRVILNAFTEVVNRVSMVENYSKSIEIKKQQLASARGLRRRRQQTFSELPASNTWTCSSPSVTSWTREWS